MVLVPGFHFFAETTTVPAGVGAKELVGLAALSIEEESPFPEEHLAIGHFVAAHNGGMLVTAALRRKFAAVQPQWDSAAFVLPDFATWLPRGAPGAGVVLLETTEAVTALEYLAGSTLPRRVVSRPVVGGDDPEAALAATREQVLARVDPAGRRVWRHRLGSPACTVKGGRYFFEWVSQDAGGGRGAEAGAFTAAQLWALDLRTPETLRTRRRDFQWNRHAWGTLLGAGVAATMLLLGEVSLLGLRFANARRADRIAAQAPAAREAEANSDIVNRLAGYIDSKPQPLELLAYVNDLRPRSVHFTKVSVDGGLQMVIEGATGSLTEVNEYEAALKRAPALASVELRNVRAREGGGTFQLTLGFRPGGVVVPAGADVAPAGSVGGVLPAPVQSVTGLSPEAGPRLPRTGEPRGGGLPGAPGMLPPGPPPVAPEGLEVSP